MLTALLPLTSPQAVTAPAQAPLRPAAPMAAPARPTAVKDSLSLATRSGSVPASAVSFSAPAAFDVIAAGKLNTTKGFKKGQMPGGVKAALEPTIKIVEAVDPKIGKALRELDENDFGLAADGMHDMFAKHDIYAAWVAVARERGTPKLHFSDMILDDRFWELRDAEKASILIHEMVHAGETPIISHFEKLAGTVWNKVKGIEWGDPVEDRAYLYQHQLSPKLGITSSDEVHWTVQTYLEDRKLVPPQKF